LIIFSAIPIPDRNTKKRLLQNTENRKTRHPGLDPGSMTQLDSIRLRLPESSSGQAPASNDECSFLRFLGLLHYFDTAFF